MYKKALGSIQAEVLVMPCRTDQYFPPEDSEIEMKYLKKGTFAPIESIWGHVAGGGMNPRDVKWMNERIGTFLAN
jgi:homoserine acetyltransferase